MDTFFALQQTTHNRIAELHQLRAQLDLGALATEQHEPDRSRLARAVKAVRSLAHIGRLITPITTPDPAATIEQRRPPFGQTRAQR